MCDINFVFLFRLKDFWVVNAYTIGRFLTAVSNVWIKINKQCLLSASLALVSKYTFLSFITNISCRKLYILLVARENGAPYDMLSAYIVPSDQPANPDPPGAPLL